MKRYIAFLLAVLLALTLTACGGNYASNENTEPQPVQQTTPTSAETTAETPAQQTAEPTPVEGTQTIDAEKTLVVYFSATGTTKGVAERLASVIGPLRDRPRGAVHRRRPQLQRQNHPRNAGAERQKRPPSDR